MNSFGIILTCIKLWKYLFGAWKVRFGKVFNLSEFNIQDHGPKRAIIERGPDNGVWSDAEATL